MAGLEFTHETFEARPGLVARSVEHGYRESIEYRGPPYDPSKSELVPGHRAHEHCTVCRIRVKPGDGPWRGRDDAWLLCDVCHDNLSGHDAASDVASVQRVHAAHGARACCGAPGGSQRPSSLSGVSAASECAWRDSAARAAAAAQSRQADPTLAVGRCLPNVRVRPKHSRG